MSLEQAVDGIFGLFDSLLDFAYKASTAIYNAKQVIDEFAEDKEAAAKEEVKLTKDYINGLYSRVQNDRNAFTEIAKKQYGTVNNKLTDEGKERVNLRLERRYFGAVQKLAEKYEIWEDMFEEERPALPDTAIRKLSKLIDFHKEKYPELALGFC